MAEISGAVKEIHGGVAARVQQCEVVMQQRELEEKEREAAERQKNRDKDRGRGIEI